MGMYDTVILDGYKLKQSKEIKAFLEEVNGAFPTEFQSKDLCSALETYKINNKGQIYIIEYKPTGKKVLVDNYFSGFKNRSFLEALYLRIKNKNLFKYKQLKIYRRVNKEVTVKSNLTSTFDIYSYGIVGESARYLDLVYKIVAVNGIVRKATLLSCDIESIKTANERIGREVSANFEYQSSQAKRQKFISSWYYPILREVYNPIVFFTKEFISYVHSLTNRWHGV